MYVSYCKDEKVLRICATSKEEHDKIIFLNHDLRFGDQIDFTCDDPFTKVSFGGAIKSRIGTELRVAIEESSGNLKSFCDMFIAMMSIPGARCLTWTGLADQSQGGMNTLELHHI